MMMPAVPPKTKTCNICGETKLIGEFYRAKKKNGDSKRMGYCKSCQGRMDKDYRKLHKIRIYYSSRNAARSRGREHTICKDDIELPETCKYLGIPLNYNESHSSQGLRPFDFPTIDRIDSTKGYVPGNIQIISDLANRMKSNATTEQLLQFARGVLRIHGEK